MEERKRCLTCKKTLIAFQKHYLHPETPCNGIPDAIEIQATISDDFLYKKFKEIYGSPKIDDSERLDILEKNWIIKGLFKLFN